jgi:hypothetical protein
MAALDALLYKWICRANARREDLDLPVGLAEESIALLKRTLGIDYLEQLLVADETPVLLFDDEANPLRKWLFSARVDEHIIQLLELASYIRTFADDPALLDKLEKLKRDRFWPVFFELAMAVRAKRACRVPQAVHLNPEIASSIGDFTVRIPGYGIPCECSRLGRSPQVAEPSVLGESLSHRISDGAKRLEVPVCIKIRSTVPLTGATYNNVLKLVRRGLADARRLKLPVEHRDGSTTVTFEILTESSEKVPGSGNVRISASEWDSGLRLYNVPARNREEITERFDSGERFYRYESVRLFTKFGEPVEVPDPFHRLTAKLKKKLKQTKTSAEHFGKIIFVEVPFDPQSLDQDRLREAVRAAALNSRSALAIILANREKNPQFRFHYSQSGTYNRNAAKMRPEVVGFFDRLSKAELNIDPVLGLPYPRPWSDAQVRARTISRPVPD